MRCNDNIEESQKLYKPYINISLDVEEEKNLMNLAAEGNKDAQDKLVLSNLNFAFNFALKKVKYSTIDLEDLIQVCIEGLVYASRHIKKDSNNKFITYAYFRILEKVDDELAKCGNKNSLSIERFKLQKKVVAIFNKHMVACCDEKKACELTTKELGIKIELVQQLLNNANKYVSYESLIERNNGNNIYGYEDKSTELPEEHAIVQDCKEIIKKAVSKLNTTNRLIIENRFGLNGKEEKNYSEISKEFNHSRAWSSKLGRKALEDLKNNYEIQNLVA